MILHLLHEGIDKGLRSRLLEEHLSFLYLVSVNLDVNNLIARHRMVARVQVGDYSHEIIELIHG